MERWSTDLAEDLLHEIHVENMARLFVPRYV